MPGTTRLYLEDDHCFDARAVVVAVVGDALACDQTCFYPGGGGQPPDQGEATLDSGEVLVIVGARADADGVVWHVSRPGPASGLVGRT
ncbi:MAG TPA: hypothetical protein VN646_00030, partial [Candidatus Acidoferrum sp.]|nr:hypothetical protein [Candidatus Acidoferrum sp.]